MTRLASPAPVKAGAFMFHRDLPVKGWFQLARLAAAVAKWEDRSCTERDRGDACPACRGPDEAPQHGMQTLAGRTRGRLKASPIRLKETVDHPYRVFHAFVSQVSAPGELTAVSIQHQCRGLLGNLQKGKAFKALK